MFEEGVMKIYLLKILIICFPLFAFSQVTIPGLSITADESSFDGRKTITLSGNVRIAFKNSHLSAGQAILDRDEKKNHCYRWSYF